MWALDYIALIAAQGVIINSYGMGPVYVWVHQFTAVVTDGISPFVPSKIVEIISGEYDIFPLNLTHITFHLFVEEIYCFVRTNSLR